jgi:hypothetical protein
MHRIRKVQFEIRALGLKYTTAAAAWNAVLFVK